MPDNQKAKWLLWFAAAILAAVFLLLSWIGQGYGHGVVLSGVVNTETARLMSPQPDVQMDSRLPEERGGAILGRWQQGNAAAGEQQHGRYQLLRFLTVLSALLFLSCSFIREGSRRFGESAVALWQNVYYIHLVDGKKDRRFLVKIG